MIRHDDPRSQFVEIAVKAAEAFCNRSTHFCSTEMTFAFSGIEPIIDAIPELVIVFLPVCL
ncbi:MAG: hypothetical protein LR011_06930 [Verrucomicrobia bacterium]|nr:hypothetical protein [Verrucomicrobiota bacterium]